jgi:methionine synthase II (cobalamin-independent)
MIPLPPLAATGIGSVPFTDPEEAAALILKVLPEIPFWPQMVRLGYQEDMVSQAVKGLPAIKADDAARAAVVDPALPRDQALAQFYEAFLGQELASFALGREEARGFYALLAGVARGGGPPAALKGQLAGPVTVAGMIKDLEGKPILFDRELTQAVCLGLARKAAWQAEEFRQAGAQPVIFFDEPFLTGFGSAFLPISRDEVGEILGSTLEATREAGEMLLGVHCCGNTDWDLLLKAPLDIVSFDSHGYFESLALYEKSLKNFYNRGGRLAWGLVPTAGEALEAETLEDLWQRFQGQVKDLGGRGFDLKMVLSQALLTPACGLGYLSPELAARALSLLGELTNRGRAWLAEMG